MKLPDDEERQRAELRGGDPVDAAHTLLQVLRTSIPPHGVEISAIRAAAADLLSDLARSPAVVELLVGALDSPSTRIVALHALALSGERTAGPPLAMLVDTCGYVDWTQEEMVGLASALGMIDGAEAIAAIALLAQRGPWPEAVEREIEIAKTAKS
jgi:hypothetical protein